MGSTQTCWLRNLHFKKITHMMCIHNEVWRVFLPSKWGKITQYLSNDPPKKQNNSPTKETKTHKQPNMNCLPSHLHLQNFYSALKTKLQDHLLTDVVTDARNRNNKLAPILKSCKWLTWPSFTSNVLSRCMPSWFVHSLKSFKWTTD